MVDTLAPKKIFTQRDLDSSLSSSNKVNTTNGSATSMVESLPKKAIVKPLINIQQHTSTKKNIHTKRTR